MSAPFRFDGKVAVVTGAGNGLGRSHALLLASRGAKIVVNDLGGSFTGDDAAKVDAAGAVVAEIRSAGGDAIADGHNVIEGDKIIDTAINTYGRVDIVICNAGILRDRAFKNMTDAEWTQVIDVHLFGSYKTARAAWTHMQAQNFGRLVFTASAAGIYGNFGQANYSAAKLGLYGLTRALAVEGAAKNINVNCIAPLAASRMAGTVFTDDMMKKLRPEAVSPLVAYLSHDECRETGSLFEVGGGWVGKVRWERARGAAFDPLAGHSIEDVAALWDEATSYDGGDHPNDVTSCFAPFAKNIGVDMQLSVNQRAGKKQESTQ